MCKEGKLESQVKKKEEGKRKTEKGQDKKKLRIWKVGNRKFIGNKEEEQKIRKSVQIIRIEKWEKE